MALEPITRQEKIIAGEDLQPITRLEKFLKEYGGSGGSGGGGSSDAVLYTPQTLTDAQKKQAMDNINAASDFVVNVTFDSNGNTTLDKTFAQIQAAIQEGKQPAVKLYASGVDPTFIPLVSHGETMIFFAVITDIGDGSITFVGVTITSAGNVDFVISLTPASNSDGTMTQFPMASDPTSPMQIATKKYVDDKECILKSTTPGSTKKFKITVDDSGNISATEVA